VFRRQFVLILAVVLLGGAAAAAYSFRRTPVYESTALVLVRAITTNAFDPGQRVDQQLNMFNQRQLALSEPVAAVAAKHLGTTATPQQLVNHASADVPANSQIVRIHYRDTVAQTAQRGAEAFATAYLAFREAEARAQAKSSQSALQKDIDRLRREVDQAEATVAAATSTPEAIRAAQARITYLNNQLEPLVVQAQGFQSLDFTPGTVIAAADLPRTPVSPKHRLDVGIGLLVGLFLGVVLGLCATAPTTACAAARTWPSGWSGRCWRRSRRSPGGCGAAGCAGGAAPGPAWSPSTSPTARPPRPTGRCGPAWPGWPASST
jgi:capsular polysaccharide biosynthesis protein